MPLKTAWVPLAPLPWATRKAAKLKRLLAFTHGESLALKVYPIGEIIQDA